MLSSANCVASGDGSAGSVAAGHGTITCAGGIDGTVVGGTDAVDKHAESIRGSVAVNRSGRRAAGEKLCSFRCTQCLVFRDSRRHELLLGLLE